MTDLALRQLGRRFGSVDAVKDVDLERRQVTVRDGRVKGFASRGLNARMHRVLRVCPAVRIG